MRIRKGFMILLSSVVLASLLTACGGSTPAKTETASAPAPAAKTDPVTIKFFHKWAEPERMAYFKSVVDNFQKANPNIKVEMEAVADEPYKDKIRVLMASGQVPDIFFSWSGEFGWKFARAGLAMDLTDTVMNSDWKDTLMTSQFGPFKWQGKLYGIPVRVNGKYMVYNKAIFQKYNLSVPTTWDEFQKVCETLKQAGVTPVSFGSQLPWAAAHYVGDLNAKLVAQDVRTKDYLLTADDKDLFTDPGYVEALKRFKLMVDKGYFTKDPNAIPHADARAAFLAGKAAMIYMELGEFKYVADSPIGKDGFGFFNFPDGTGGKGDPNLLTGAPDGFMVSAKTKYPKESIAFLKYLTNKENGAAFTKQLGLASATVGAVTPESALPAISEGVKILEKASGMALWLDTDLNVKVVEVYLPGMQAVLSGAKTPEQVIAEVREAAIKTKKAQ